MTGQAQVQEKVSLGGKIVFILLAGALSMFFAEVCSGSSVLWFITSWAWLVTFWLYLAHTILFINLALYFKRTSLTSLYLWGVFFGLYEAWITKVAWAGYGGANGPGMGTILGFALPEFPLITFFWHPVMSFILPVLAFEALSGRILPDHLPILTKNKRNWLLAALIVILGATFLAFNSGSNIVSAVVTAVGSFAIIGVLYFIASRKYGKQFTIESLRLGKKGMTIILVYLALLYVLAFFLILPQRIAPPLTILLTLGVYAVIAILLYLKKPDVAGPAVEYPDKKVFGIRDLAILAVAFVILSALASLVPQLNLPLTQVIYVILFLISPAIIILAAAFTIISRLKSKATGA